MPWGFLWQSFCWEQASISTLRSEATRNRLQVKNQKWSRAGIRLTRTLYQDENQEEVSDLSLKLSSKLATLMKTQKPKPSTEGRSRKAVVGWPVVEQAHWQKETKWTIWTINKANLKGFRRNLQTWRIKSEAEEMTWTRWWSKCSRSCQRMQGSLEGSMIRVMRELSSLTQQESGEKNTLL